MPTWSSTRACESIDYTRYDIFVGVYPNDPRTLEKARNAAGRFPQIHVVIGGHAGPSSKAENLNEIFEGMLRNENRTGVRYELIVLHDAEDVIHPQSLRAFNVFIPRYDMVQIPVFPLPNAILFPQALLPLYIFEERYRKMLKDCLVTDRMFAVALIPKGNGKHPPDSKPCQVAGLGIIRAAVGNDDGTSNVILQGSLTPNHCIPEHY